MEELNHTLRRALKLEVDGLDLTAFNKTLDAKEFQQTLCHTPHFLDKPDRNGPIGEKKVLSAYNTSGHF
jgi:hypothetical protein